MKRAAAVAIIMILAAASLCALNPRLSAMGGIGIGVAGADMQGYVNPASVFFDENRYTFSFHADIEDTMGNVPLPYLPGSTIDALFVADMITMNLNIAYNSENYRPENGHVDIMQLAMLNVNFSAGYRFISGGIGVTGGSTQQRLDVQMDSVIDFPLQTFLSPFDRVVNSEFIQVSAGLMAKFGNLNIGMLMADILGKDGSNNVLNWDTLFSHTGVGFYWSRDQYSSRGRLNNFIYSFGAEVDYLFSDIRRFNAGAEVQFRMVRDSSIFARAGYTALISEMGEGTITAGFGATMRIFEVALNADIPIGGNARVKAVLTVLL